MGMKQHVSQLITIIQFRCLILQLVLALTKKIVKMKIFNVYILQPFLFFLLLHLLNDIYGHYRKS